MKPTRASKALLHWIAPALLFLTAFPTLAADHGDAPLMAQDVGADIADVYFFLDPANNGRVIIIQTHAGFIVPGEAENLGIFDHSVNYRFAIETDGKPDAISDIDFNVRFSPKRAFDEPQLATVEVLGIAPEPVVFQAPTTVASATATQAPGPVLTTDPASLITLFAGMVDDPFFLDVPAQLRYLDSRMRGFPDPRVFRRGRDTFAGYNVMAIALSVPIELLLNGNGTVLGLSSYTERAATTMRSRESGVVDSGAFVVIDRMGIPLINRILIPYEKKDSYNRSSTSLDPNGNFWRDILASLIALRTGSESRKKISRLAVEYGDLLRLDTAIGNTGGGGGDNPEAAFPNGRRLRDDVIDTVVTIINNGVPVSSNGVVDRVNANDKTFLDQFPFLAPPHQPLQSGVDPTRN